ncbi:hypothetical protein Q0P47_14165, partial [Staphylococcus aureus]|nr:hypothetical protein [Staphylococcus aureus]
MDADVIIAADGVKSKAREAMMARKGVVDEGEWVGWGWGTKERERLTTPLVEDTGQAAYRIMVRRAAIKEDPDLVP